MNDTLFLRFIAIILITNSHLENLYPIPCFAAGGQWGNTLFFMLSGLGLTLSAEKSHQFPAFQEWFCKRLSRIYPSIWIVVLLIPVILKSGWRYWNPGDYLYHLIYPTSYWFISALLVFYLIVYPVLKYQWLKKIPQFILLLLVPYFYFYLTALDLSRLSVESAGLFKWIPYLQILMFGMCLAPAYRQWKKNNIGPGKNDWIIWILVCLVYIILKFFIAKGVMTHFQFLLQWLMFPFAYFSLKLAQHSFISDCLKLPVLGFLIQAMSMSTLEIYLLQLEFYKAPWLVTLGFPLNTIAFWLILASLAYAVHHLAERTRHGVSRQRIDS